MSKLKDIFGYRKLVEGLVGVEIEVEGINLPTEMNKFWKVTKDGSLRGEEAYEYISKKPFKLEKLRESFDFFDAAMKEKNAQILKSDRTSTHIHVNVQESEYEDIFGILFAWSMAERVWMTLCGENRSGNLFCLPLSSCGFSAEYAARYLRAQREFRFDRVANMCGKYSALNLDPVYSQGSVEFRTFPCSVDPNQLMSWVGWCTKLVEYGQSIDRNNLTKEWTKVYENPEDFLQYIFSGDHKQIPDLFRYELVRQGCVEAADLTLVWAQHITEPVVKKMKIDFNEWNVLKNAGLQLGD